MVIFLTIITCGIFGFYVFDQLMKRMRDHNRRRLDLLESATEIAWQRASEQGVAEELRPNFERIAANVAVIRGLTTEFRDPGIWVIIAILTSIAYFVGFVFLDGDLIKHDQAEGGIQAELSRSRPAGTERARPTRPGRRESRTTPAASWPASSPAASTSTGGCTTRWTT